MAEEPSPRTGRRTLSLLVVSRAIEQLSLGIGSLLLARSLGPAAFGPLAAVIVVNSLAVQVADLGLGFAVLRVPDGVRLSTRSLRRVRQAGLLVAVVGVSVGAAWRGDVGAVIAGSAVLWPLCAESYVRRASALRQRHSREVALADVTGAAVFAGGVALSLVVGPNVGLLVLALVGKQVVEVLVVRSWRASFAPDGEAARSGPEWLSQIITYLVANADYVILAAMLGSADLSKYVIAFRAASAVPALVGTPITQTAFVDLSSAHSPEHRQASYLIIIRRVLTIGSLGAVGIMVVAPFLQVFLGESWRGTAGLIVLLAFAVPFRLLLGTSAAQAITAGAVRAFIGWESARLVIMSVAAATGALFGLTPATAAVSLAAIATLSVEHGLACQASGLRPQRGIGMAAIVAAAAVVATLVVLS